MGALVDFDHFKAFNDTFGHTAEDEVLRAFAAEASATLRGSDVFARCGSRADTALYDAERVGRDRRVTR